MQVSLPHMTGLINHLIMLHEMVLAPVVFYSFTPDTSIALLSINCSNPGKVLTFVLSAPTCLKVNNAFFCFLQGSAPWLRFLGTQPTSHSSSLTIFMQGRSKSASVFQCDVGGCTEACIVNLVLWQVWDWRGLVHRLVFGRARPLWRRMPDVCLQTELTPWKNVSMSLCARSFRGRIAACSDCETSFCVSAHIHTSRPPEDTWCPRQRLSPSRATTEEMRMCESVRGDWTSTRGKHLQCKETHRLMITVWRLRAVIWIYRLHPIWTLVMRLCNVCVLSRRETVLTVNLCYNLELEVQNMMGIKINNL